MEPTAYDELFELEMDHGWYKGMRTISKRFLDGVLMHNQPIRILDAGCGTGANMLALSQYGTTYGFDYSPLAVNYAQRRGLDRITRASIEFLPYPDSSFDMVTTFDVLYHRAVKDDGLAISEMARVLKPGGHLLIRVPAMPAFFGPHDEFVHGARRYTRTELKGKLERAGMTIDRFSYANSLVMPAVFVSRKFRAATKSKYQNNQSDVGSSTGLMSAVLQIALNIESLWIGIGAAFPAGVSLFCLATKP